MANQTQSTVLVAEVVITLTIVGLRSFGVGVVESLMVEVVGPEVARHLVAEVTRYFVGVARF